MILLQADHGTVVAVGQMADSLAQLLKCDDMLIFSNGQRIFSKLYCFRPMTARSWPQVPGLLPQLLTIVKRSNDEAPTTDHRMFSSDQNKRGHRPGSCCVIKCIMQHAAMQRSRQSCLELDEVLLLCGFQIHILRCVRRSPSDTFTALPTSAQEVDTP